MKTKITLAMLTAGLFIFPVYSTLAADQDRDQTRQQLQDKEMIYGYDLMTVEERAQHRAKMQSFATEEEREAYREEHHKLMQARAKERGVEIPEVPRRKSMMGPQSGMRSGGGFGGGTGGGAGSGSGGGSRK